MHAYQRRAVTRIDLVVSTGCLLIIGSLLGPAAASVSSVSKQAHCLSNLRRIGHANHIYSADDPSNPALPVHRLYLQQDPENLTWIGAYEWGGKSGIGSPGYTDGPTEGPDAFVSSKYGTQIGFGPATRPLNYVLYGALTDYTNTPGPSYSNWLADTQLDFPEMQCPSDTQPPPGAHCPDWLAHPERSSYDHFGTSYSANIFMTEQSNNMSSRSPYLNRLDRIPNPAETLAFMENNGRWAWAVRALPECRWIGEGVYPQGTIPGWHGKNWTFAAGFVDGHAEFIYMNGQKAERQMLNADTQDFYRCVIVRGVGWRIDTAPLEHVPTIGHHLGPGRPADENCVSFE